MAFASSPFGSRLPSNAAYPLRSDVNSQRFTELKPLCVQLLGQCSPPGQHDRVRETLQRLADKLTSFSSEPALSPSLIAYIFFPLAQLFRALSGTPDRVQRLLFVVLRRLVDDWWPAWIGNGEKADEQRRVWEQLAMLSIMALGKEDGQSEETASAIVGALHSLLAPRFVEQKTSVPQDGLGQWEWDGESELPDLDDYEREMKRLNAKDCVDARPSMQLVYPDHGLLSYAKTSVQAQILVKALDLARQERLSRSLRVSSLRLVRILLHVWSAQELVDIDPELRVVVKEGKTISRSMEKSPQHSERVKQMNSLLPGVCSSVKGILRSKKVVSSVTAESLSVLVFVIPFCLSDEHVKEPITSISPVTLNKSTRNLEDLIAHASIEDTGVSLETEEVPLDTTTSFDERIQDTASRVGIVLQSIQPLISSKDAGVQVQVVDLAGHLLDRCWRFCELANVQTMLFTWLVDIASMDDVSRKASERAIAFMVKISGDRSHLIKTELADGALSLPRLLLLVRQDEQLLRKSNRIAFLIRLASGKIDEDFTRFDVLHNSFSAKSFQRWSLSLVGSFVFDVKSQSSIRGFEASTSRAFLHLFEDLGAAAAQWQLSQDNVPGDALSTVEYLLKLSQPGTLTSVDTANNAAVLASRMMVGVAKVFEESRLALLSGREAMQTRKRASKFARQVVIRLTDAWQALEEEASLPDTGNDSLTDEERRVISEHADPHDRLMTDYQRGVPATDVKEEALAQARIETGSMLNVDFVQSATIRQMHTSNFRRSKQGSLDLSVRAQQIDASKLSIIASAAIILGPSIKPLLIQTIYPMICALASASKDLQTAASHALETISYAAGYASVQGCILDHADYILGAATHRLVSTLGYELQQKSERNQKEHIPIVSQPLVSALAAPLVLVELIRLLGNEVIALVEDAIDEVLEAIDRFHGDEEICDSLLSVLDRMLEVMLEYEQTLKREQVEAPQNGFQADNRQDLEDFKRWLRLSRKEGAEATSEQGEEPRPQTPVEREESEVTRTQVTTVSMLKKAVPFLSHHSRVVRMRCLRLINRGVELLCRQGLKAEPLSVLSMCWPILMSRLGFSLSRPLPKTGSPTGMVEEQDFYVAIEAVKLISTAAHFLINYLGNDKIMRQAVPRLLLLVDLFERAERAHMHSGRAKPPKTFLLGNNDQPTPKSSPPRFEPLRPHSPLLILLEQVLITLDTVVSSMGAAITEDDLYRFAVHAAFLSCLDTRQPESIRSHALHFYHHTLTKRNASLVWLTIQGAKSSSATSKLLPFLGQPHLSL